MNLSIILLHYKSTGLLKQCLKGLYLFGMEKTSQIIVVDNGSSEQCRQMVHQYFPEVTFITAGRNLGYAAGVNLGLRQATGRYFLILNPDIALLKNDIQTMIDYLDGHPAVGLLGPKLINPDGTSQYTCYRFPQFILPLYRRTFIGHLPFAKRRLANYLMTDWDHASNRAVDWLLGGCLLARRAAVEKVGLFDERFFLYVEDVDWCRRFWQAGYAVVYFAEAEIVHYHQRTSAELSWWRGIWQPTARWHIASWLKYFLKYRGLPLPQTTLDLPL